MVNCKVQRHLKSIQNVSKVVQIRAGKRKRPKLDTREEEEEAAM